MSATKILVVGVGEAGKSTLIKALSPEAMNLQVEGRTVAMGGSPFLTAGCHAIDALRWFAAQDEFSAAEPVAAVALRKSLRFMRRP